MKNNFFTKKIENKEDGFYHLQNFRKVKNQYSEEIIFDGIWKLIKNDWLGYNIDWFNENGKFKHNKRLQEILNKMNIKIADLLLFANFKKPDNKIINLRFAYDLEKILWKYPKWDKINVWYTDTIFIRNLSDFMKDMWINSLALWWAVADCGAIIWISKDKNAVSITHAWYTWIFNWVLETLIKTFKENPWASSEADFYISPMAGVNYEFNNIFNPAIIEENYTKAKKKFEKVKDLYEWKYWNDWIVFYCLWNVDWYSDSDLIVSLEIMNNKIYPETKKKYLTAKYMYELTTKYNIDFIKDKIFEPYKNNPEKWIFYLRRLIKRIFLELWVKEENLHFHPDDTTNFDNKWPSYRVHSLWKNGIIPASATKKAENWIVYDSRIWAFVVINK